MRDVYDLVVSPGAAPGEGRIELIVLDTATGAQLAWEEGRTVVRISTADVVG